ncbi:MAG: hypothetical protein AB7G39_13010 [Alphaproteobacteria bacterium]
MLPAPVPVGTVEIAMRAFAFAALVLLLAGCSEESYRRGYSHGATDVCTAIDKFSTRMYDTLRREQIC